MNPWTRRQRQTAIGCCGTSIGAAMPGFVPSGAVLAPRVSPYLSSPELTARFAHAFARRFGGTTLLSPQAATVTWHEGAAIRVEPRPTAPAVTAEPAGAILRVLAVEIPASDGSDGEWWRVANAIGQVGYVRAFHDGTRDVTILHANPPPSIQRITASGRTSAAQPIRFGADVLDHVPTQVIPPGAFVPAGQIMPQRVPSASAASAFRPGHQWLAVLQTRRQASQQQALQAAQAAAAAQAQADQASAIAEAQGLTDRVRCTGPDFWQCGLYQITTDAQGISRWKIIREIPGGTTSLLTSLARRTQVFIQGTGIVFVYPVLWPDAPGGPLLGWLPDGGFTS